MCYIEEIITDSRDFLVWRCLKCTGLHMRSAVVILIKYGNNDSTSGSYHTHRRCFLLTDSLSTPLEKLDVFRQCNSVSYLAVRYKKFVEIILFSFANKIILYCKKYCISIVYMWMLVRSVHLVETLMKARNSKVL